ncbi:MAG: nucleoside recognition domain-containing protein [Prevotellaceae bacterium]|nr:nucleoside recognition domain-containing protein [Prevotellaceae bacterium]MDY3856654.1 nucleoside recognition domain-containing protein [Bacteroidaceae bacterium]
MALNYIWLAFFFVAFLIGAIKLVFLGDTQVFPDMMNSTFSSAKTAFEISLGLTGVLAFWLGIMKIGERGGIINTFSRWLSPFFCKLFPDIPKNHPVYGNIFMNFAANMLGLDNAATPLGLKAMEGLQSLNPKKDTASNPMIMFLVLNTSGLCLIPVGVMVYRAQCGAAQPTDIFIPILLATTIATLVGIIVTALVQHINLLDRTLILGLGAILLFLSVVVWGFSQMDRETMGKVASTSANVLLFTVIIGFLWSGFRRKINVYNAFVDGAKEGFQTAVRIIPFLVAMLVGIGVFRASGAMDWLVDGMRWGVGVLGLPTDWVDALPTALMKPLSGSGSRGMMVDEMMTYGADSFVGHLCCLLQGSTDTTFYILAVYFGSVNISKTRHAVGCGLAADFAGTLAAILMAYLFFS